jgi:hypothetical protein
MNDVSRGSTVVQPNEEGEAVSDLLLTDYDPDHDLGIMRDGDSWFIVDVDGNLKAGPFTNKIHAQSALRMRCGYGRSPTLSEATSKREESNMNAWEQLDRLADMRVAKSENGRPLSHAQRVAKFLRTPEGAALYERGKLAPKDFSIMHRVEKSTAPVSKRDSAWNTIELHAQQRQREMLGRVSFAKCVDAACREFPELYAAYRNS